MTFFDISFFFLFFSMINFSNQNCLIYHTEKRQKKKENEQNFALFCFMQEQQILFVSTT